SPYGIHIIVASVLQGIGVEIVMGISKYKNYSIINMALAGIVATIFVTARDYFVFGLELYANLMIIMIMVRLVSAAVLGGVLSVVIGNALKATGVLNGFKIKKADNCNQ
ncbi:ECF transporter S component, partial [Clostridium sp.]|uniref:ECF transporter S component n=1 Tax=Clostridium sp. TaxID=1506 RepID=UPI003F402FCE